MTHSVNLMRRQLTSYGYFCLDAVSLLGDSVFLYFSVFSLMNYPHGTILSSVVFALDSAIQVVLNPITARWVDSISSLQQRLTLSIFIKPLLAFIALLPGFLQPNSQIKFYIFLAILAALRCFSNVDMQLRLKLPLALHEQKIFSLTKSSSLSNLGMRGVHIIGPVIALWIGSQNWFQAALFNSVSFLFGLLAVLLGKIACHNGKDAMLEPVLNVPSNSSDLSLWKAKLAKWNYAFLFLSNLGVGAIALLLARLTKSYEQLPLFQIFPPITSLYTGMTLTLIVVLLIPIHWHSLEQSSTKRASLFVGLLSLCFLIAAFVNPISSLIIFFISGIVYAVSLVVNSHAILKKLQGDPKLIQYVSQAQAAGRIGMIVSILFAGFCFDNNMPLTSLLLIFGLFGIFSSGVLVFLRHQFQLHLEEKV